MAFGNGGGGYQPPASSSLPDDDWVDENAGPGDDTAALPTVPAPQQHVPTEPVRYLQGSDPHGGSFWWADEIPTDHNWRPLPHVVDPYNYERAYYYSFGDWWRKRLGQDVVPFVTSRPRGEVLPWLRVPTQIPGKTRGSVVAYGIGFGLLAFSGIFLVLPAAAAGLALACVGVPLAGLGLAGTIIHVVRRNRVKTLKRHAQEQQARENFRQARQQSMQAPDPGTPGVPTPTLSAAEREAQARQQFMQSRQNIATAGTMPPPSPQPPIVLNPHGGRSVPVPPTPTFPHGLANSTTMGLARSLQNRQGAPGYATPQRTVPRPSVPPGQAAPYPPSPPPSPSLPGSWSPGSWPTPSSLPMPTPTPPYGNLPSPPLPGTPLQQRWPGHSVPGSWPPTPPSMPTVSRTPPAGTGQSLPMPGGRLRQGSPRSQLPKSQSVQVQKTGRRYHPGHGGNTLS